jgi:hypothetical protein
MALFAEPAIMVWDENMQVSTAWARREMAIMVQNTTGPGAAVEAESPASEEPCNRKEARTQRVIMFSDSQAAIDGTLEAWLPRLVSSNDALEAALALLRDLYLARHSVPAGIVLRQVEDALNQAARAKSAF